MASKSRAVSRTTPTAIHIPYAAVLCNRKPEDRLHTSHSSGPGVAGVSAAPVTEDVPVSVTDRGGSVCGPPSRAPAGRYHLGIKSDAGRRESFRGDRFVGSANFMASGGTLWASESVQPPDGHLDVSRHSTGGRKLIVQDADNCLGTCPMSSECDSMDALVTKLI